MGHLSRRFVAVIALVVATRAFALDPSRALTQPRLSVWTSETGLPQGTINAMVQTSDGYLWMGTEEGLVRFDGIRFVVSDQQNAPALRTPFISALFEATDGTLWIGTYGGGIARMRNGKIEAFRPDVLATDRIRQFRTMRDGGLLVATAGGGLLRIHGEDVTRYTTRDGLPSDRIWTIADDHQGGFWVATHGFGVVHWRDGKVLPQQITTKEGLPNDVARALLLDADGTMWIGTDGGGLAQWRNGAIIRTITTRDGLPNDFVRTLRRDRDGSMWIGTDSGLARWRGDRAEAMGVAEGLPSPGIRSMIEDREGSLWIGTTSGLVRMRDTRVLPYTRKEGLPADAIRAILQTSDGRVWAGTEGGGLCQVLPGPVQCHAKAEGLPHDSVYALVESRDGSLWVGTDGGGVVRYRGGKFVDPIRGLPNDRVRSLVEMPNGDLWIATSAGLAVMRGGKMIRVDEFNDRQLRPMLLLPDGSLLIGTDGAGLWRMNGDGTNAKPIAEAGRGLESDRIFCLTMDSEGGGVWIGTSGGGLARLDLKDFSVQSLTRHDGLYDDVVFYVVDPGPGADLWLTSNRGVYRVKRAEVMKAMRGMKADLRGTVYGPVDGMPSAECNGAFPAATATRDGRVWIATSRGIAVINPRSNMRNEFPPPVHVEEATIDGTVILNRADGEGSASARLRMTIPPGTQRLELRYSALSLRAPELVKFRYMLEGYDRDWVDAGTNRVATYTKLAPGNYTFRVMATNEDGVQSKADGRLAMIVEPRWFETWWARLIAIAILGGIVWLFIRLRLAALHKRHAELEALVAERTSSLRAERERAEAASRAKSDFLANMSHELRTPLNAVLGFVQLMERRAGRDPVDREHLGIITRSGEHLLGLINEVLSLSKIEAGLAKRTDAPFNLGRLLRGLGELFQAKTRSKNLALLIEIDRSADVTVSGDEGKLRQIVMNLLGNAVKFTERGRIVLRASWSDGRGFVEVEDSGPGIDPTELHQVFEAFAQSESGRRANEGTGLGLAISRGLARIHGGDVTIESRIGAGTTVFVQLELPPASDAPARAPRTAARVKALASGEAPPLILVLDHAPDNRQLLAELLGAAGCRVIEAADEAQAVARMREEAPDLVFLDRANAINAIRNAVVGGQAPPPVDRVGQAPPPVQNNKPTGEGACAPTRRMRIVVLSASAFDHERVDALSRGADAFLPKPFREQAVFAQIETLLGVRFEREDEHAEIDSGPITPESIAQLPADLRMRIKTAAAGGESDVLHTLAEEAAAHNAAIGAELESLARAYRFDEIEAALKEIPR